MVDLSPPSTAACNADLNGSGPAVAVHLQILCIRGHTVTHDAQRSEQSKRRVLGRFIAQVDRALNMHTHRSERVPDC